MSQPFFLFTSRASAPRVSFQKLHYPQLSLAVSKNAVSVWPRSGADAPSQMQGIMEKTDRPDWHGKLFSNRAELKVLTSRVAMHLSDVQRSDMFEQIDDLLDPENWTSGDSLIRSTSYSTFLRFLIYYHGVKRPALTVSSSGNISASWVGASQRLTIEFHDRDVIRLVLYRKESVRSEPETAAYQGPVERLDAVLGPFGAVSWYRNAAA